MCLVTDPSAGAIPGSTTIIPGAMIPAGTGTTAASTVPAGQSAWIGMTAAAMSRETGVTRIGVATGMKTGTVIEMGTEAATGIQVSATAEDANSAPTAPRVCRSPRRPCRVGPSTPCPALSPTEVRADIAGVPRLPAVLRQMPRQASAPRTIRLNRKDAIAAPCRPAPTKARNKTRRGRGRSSAAIAGLYPRPGKTRAVRMRAAMVMDHEAATGAAVSPAQLLGALLP